MKAPIAALALALACLASAPALSRSQGLPSSARSPIAGRWTLDLASMTIPADARPRAVSVDFADLGDGTWSATYVITAKDGSERRMTSHERPDGKAVAIQGDQMEADSVAITRPAPGVLVMALAKDGRPGSVRVYTVSADGRTMTENAANVGDDGKPFIRTFRWTR